MTPGQRSSPAAQASPLENDDLLSEILLRLPPQPSSLPRASAVCKHWRGLVADPRFVSRFSAHNRKPPLLGFFEDIGGIIFNPVLDPPDRVPAERFSLGRYSGRPDIDLLGCRHGRLLLIDRQQRELLVCNPIAPEQLRVDVPPDFKRSFLNGAVLCAAGDQSHVHGSCHSSPFTVVLVSISVYDSRPYACVYSSKTGIWRNVTSTEAPCTTGHSCVGSSPSTLVGNILYWVLSSICHGILEYDLDRQNLALTKGPPITNDCHTHRIIQAEDGNVGLASFSYPSFQMWHRRVNHHGVATWFLHKTVDMHNICRTPSQTQRTWRKMVILGYDEDNDVIFLHVDSNTYIVELKAIMQPMKLNGTHSMIHPFTSFHMPGIATAAGYGGSELQDTWDDSGFMC